MPRRHCAVLVFSVFASACMLGGAAPPDVSERERVLTTMKRATTFMVEVVSHEGGYVWNYLPDFSRTWGEMEANRTMIWMQPPGTPGMGGVFLEAYRATGDEYYYRAAAQAGHALIRAQHPSGGWNYVADLAGEESLRKWYETIGRNGWRLEEFQHYYGNATFDDLATTAPARFMLRLYLEKRDPAFKASLDKAIRFVLDAQYPSGGWPQRFPLMSGFSKNGNPDYTGFITFNDDVAIANIDFLIECHQVLGDERFLDPIRRAMESFVITQRKAPQAGWAMQYTPELEPAGARTYEPRALAPATTARNIGELIRFYHLTGDRHFLARIPEAFAWLDSVKFALNARDVRGTHPTFVEIGMNRPLFIHRSGSNVRNGRYYSDQDPTRTAGHYSSFRSLDVDRLRQQYQAALATTPDEATKDSPLKARTRSAILPDITRDSGNATAGKLRGGLAQRAADTVDALNDIGYWPSRLLFTSHPYKGESPAEVAEGDFMSTRVGDAYDTSPYENPEQETCISVAIYIRNMHTLIQFLKDIPQ